MLVVILYPLHVPGTHACKMPHSVCVKLRDVQGHAHGAVCSVCTCCDLVDALCPHHRFLLYAALYVWKMMYVLLHVPGQGHVAAKWPLLCEHLRVHAF